MSNSIYIKERRRRWANIGKCSLANIPPNKQNMIQYTLSLDNGLKTSQVSYKTVHL